MTAFSQLISTGGTAGDIVGTVTCDLGTTATITIENFNDADATFVFSYTVTGDAHVSQDGVTREADPADSLGQFTLVDDTGATLIGPVTVSASTSTFLLPGSSTPRARYRSLYRADMSAVLTVTARSSGSDPR